jgi:hypothetical protein
MPSPRPTAATSAAADAAPEPATGHTPGPWKVEQWEIGEARRPQTVVTGPGDAVAYVQDLWPGPGHERTSERTANANIIAAAPEMLESLRFAAAMLNQPVWGTDSETASAARIMRSDAQAVRKALAHAIARAEGSI